MNMFQPDDLDKLIDTALNSYPVQPLPAGFVQRTLTRISRPEPFHIQPSDFILPLALTSLVLIVTAILLWFNGLLMISWLPKPDFDPAGMIARLPFSWLGFTILIFVIEAIAGVLSMVSFFLLADRLEITF